MPNLLITHGFESNYTVGFAKGLKSTGVDFVALSSDEIAARLESNAIANRNIRGSQESSRPAAAKIATILGYYLSLMKAVVHHRGKTIHFTGILSRSFILFDGTILALWIRLWSRCYIHTAHNTLPHSREKSRYFRAIYRLFYRIPHLILVHSPKVGEQLEKEFGVNPARVRCISIGLNEEVPTTNLTRADARRMLGLEERERVALFFGKVEAYKGVDLLAEGWGTVQTPNARLIIAGWASDSAYSARVKELIANSPKRASMEWQEGFVPNDRVEALLKACDVVVLPYRNIYQSGVIFLCLRFGVPVVATNVGSMTEFIDKESGVIAQSCDPAGIAAAIDHFFAQPGAFARDVIARRAEKYSWDRQCLAIKNLYC